MSQQHPTTKPGPSSQAFFGFVLLVTALLAAYVFVRETPSGTGTLPSPGSVAPPIRALGWLNGGPPGEDQLAGNVVVIDCFASW